MTESPPKAKLSFGLSQRPEQRQALTASDMVALGLSVGWLALCALFLLVLPRQDGTGFDGFRFVMTVLSVFLPVALIWVASYAARVNRMMRDESQRLQVAVDAMRQAYIAANQAQVSAQRPDLDKRLDELLRSQKRTEALVAQITSGPQYSPDPVATVNPAPVVRPITTRPEPDAAQPSLALGTPEEAPDPISTDDFIKALNFPEDEGDKEGFRALRVALKDHTCAGLIRSAQDVLTLLAEDGIYMDDLSPDRSRPEVWRKFAVGVRGPAISSLGGVRDRSSLALTAGRMRQDAVFRDVAHHFLRKFDQTFAAFEQKANDADIAAVADTRTARAFMLLGRVSGTFD